MQRSDLMTDVGGTGEAARDRYKTDPKSTWIAVILGSSVLAAVVSALLGFYLGKETKERELLYKIDTGFVTVINEVYKAHPNDKVETLSFIEQVIIPIYHYNPLYQSVLTNLTKTKN